MNISDFLSVVLSLVILEFLLSVDNALVNASIAQKLPHHQRASALRIGVALAAIFRVLALLLASFIIHNGFLKVIGALYLLYLMFDHLGSHGNEEGNNIKTISFRNIVWHIAIADIVFSIDNIVSAVGLSSNIAYVIFGVLIGMASILLMSKVILKVLKRYPHLAVAGYIIVGFIGAVMLLEQLAHWLINPELKFAVIVGMAVFTVVYERSSSVQKVASPVLLVAHKILILPTKLLPAKK